MADLDLDALQRELDEEGVLSYAHGHALFTRLRDVEKELSEYAAKWDVHSARAIDAERERDDAKESEQESYARYQVAAKERDEARADWQEQQRNFVEASTALLKMRGELDEARAELAAAIAGNWREASTHLRERAEIAEKERDEAWASLTKINDVRNSIVGAQTMNWSEHVYPLVAALEAAGVAGMPYPEARENVGTLIERATSAEARVKELERVRDVVSDATQVGDKAIINLRDENAALCDVVEAARAFNIALGFVYWVTACDEAGVPYELVEKACKAGVMLEKKLAALDAAKETR